MIDPQREWCCTETPYIRYRWTSRALCWLKSIMSVVMADTVSFRAAFQVVLITIHSGKHFPITDIHRDAGDERGLHNHGRFPPWDRAPPQLSQVQMVRHNMAGHAGHDEPPTMRIWAWLQAAKPAPTLPALRLQVSLMLRHPWQQGFRPHCSCPVTKSL